MLLIDPITCLAAALYFEARGELKINQLRVAEVIYNRVESKRYPNTICEVVKENDQFTFFWDGKKEEMKDKNAWKLSLQYATQSLDTHLDMKGYCNYAHVDVDNDWTRKLQEDKQTHGAHVFYKGEC